MAAPLAPLVLKRNYRCVPTLQQFYGGGPFAVTSDGATLACACGEEVKIVDSSSGAVRATIEGDSAPVTAVALSPDDRFLFSAGHSRLIRVWDLSTFKCIRSWKGHDGPVMAMACHASGGLLATGGADKRICIWDVDGGFCTHVFEGHEGVVTCIMFHPHPDRLLLFSGSDDASVRVWNLKGKKGKQSTAMPKKHFSSVTSLALSEDGFTLLSAGRDKVVNMWDLHEFSHKMTIPAFEMVEAVCVVPSGTIFASLTNELSSGKKKRNGVPPIYFLTVGECGIVRIWSSECAVCLYEQQNADATLSSDDSRRGFLDAIILPLDQGLLCTTADQQFLFYRPMKSSEEAYQLNLYRRLVGYNEEILDMKFLGEEEKFLAVATNLEQVRVYDLSSMSCVYVLAGHTDIVVCLDTCVSISGRTLLVSGSKDNSVRLWDVESKHCIGIGKGHTGAVGAVAFSKKSRKFFVSGSSDHTIMVWSLDHLSEDADQEIMLKTKKVVAAHSKDINSLAVAPNDNLICSGSEDRTACIWRLPDLVSIARLNGHKRGVWSVEFSPVDQCVLTSSGDKTIKIWAISDGSCLKTFQGHTASVLRATFLTRGTQIVSCGGDGLVKLWTVKSNECIADYDQHEGKVWALAVGKVTEMLATGGTDAVVNLWHDCTAEDKQEAFHKEEEAILRGQELDNAVSDADYCKAIQLAFELRRPHKLYDLFSQLCRKRDGDNPVQKALSGLGREEIRVLLEYIREWNTKPKLCHVAQFVFYWVFCIFPPTELVEIKGISELLEGLIPYSQRHYSRIDRLVRSTFLFDFLLSGMSVLEPEEPAMSLEMNARDEHLLKDDGLVNGAPASDVSNDQTMVLSDGGEKVSAKRQKPNKSGRVSKKKVKLSSNNDSSAI